MATATMLSIFMAKAPKSLQLLKLLYYQQQQQSGRAEQSLVCARMTKSTRSKRVAKLCYAKRNGCREHIEQTRRKRLAAATSTTTIATTTITRAATAPHLRPKT